MKRIFELLFLNKYKICNYVHITDINNDQEEENEFPTMEVEKISDKAG